MAQDISDLTGVPVVRPDLVETTALGVAMLAAVGAGLHPSLDAAAGAMIGPEKRFEPVMDADVRERRLAAWRAALASL
jgi:glycerol kinase